MTDADRLGVVHTPNEIVRFMIDGADWVLHHHKNKVVDLLQRVSTVSVETVRVTEAMKGAAR